MAPLKIGLIGAGFVGTAHLEAIRRSGLGEVVAIAQSSEEHARRKARELGIPRAYGDWRALLADPEVQVIHNCTPNHLHVTVGEAAILAGKHILSEKPLAMNSQQSGRLLELARERGITHGVCFNYRHYPLVQELRSRLAGAGQIHAAYGGYMQDWLLHEHDYNWRLEPHLGGDSRAVSDIGSHWVDTVSYVLGQRVVQVCADVATVHPNRLRPVGGGESFSGKRGAGESFPVATEDLGSVLVRFEGGARGCFTVSQVTAGRKNRLHVEVAAAGNAYAWDQEEPNRLWIGHRDRPNEVLMRDPALLGPAARRLAHYPGGHEEGWPDALRNLVASFYEYISQQGDPNGAAAPFATFADGHYAVRVVEAIMVSARESRWVDLA